jgi:cell division protein FtsQ
MTATTIRRKPVTARKAAAQQSTARKVAQAKAGGRGAIDRAVGWLPLTEHQLQRLFLGLILLVVLGLALAVALAAGVPQLAGGRFAQIASQAGFEVRRVDVRGIRNMNENRVYERVLSERNRSMPLVDLVAIRQDLLALPWVKDARISRQLPDTLVVDIVERVPHAVLRKPGGRLVLIDDEGHELDAVAPNKVGRMLVVSGPGSGERTVDLDRLMQAAPALRPQVREAEWIGNRRWNLTFRTGQVLALPEGGRLSADALATFARLDGTSRMLGGRVTAFDMRAGDRIYLRVPGAAQEEAAAEAKQKKENP